MSIGCPLSNNYAPKFPGEKRGLIFRLVYPNANESDAAIDWHMQKFKSDIMAKRDPKHDLVLRSNGYVTPEAAVYMPRRGGVYHGRIDDRYAAFGKARSEAQKHDLRNVLTKVADGIDFQPFSTREVGCYIEGSR